MLNVSGICRLPSTPLQPTAPLRQISVPVDGMPELGLIRRANGERQSVTYYSEYQSWSIFSDAGPPVQVWYLDDQWTEIVPTRLASGSNPLPAASQYQTFALPALPVFPVNVQPIPREIHYLWLGNTVPRQGLIDNIASNCRNSSTFRSTLHVDTSDPGVLSSLEEAFSTVRQLTVEKLNGSSFFSQFKQSDRMQQYLDVTTGPGRNYSAASDVLRYPLIDHRGGMYMDVDDTLMVDIKDMEFFAAPNDVLLGSTVSEALAGFKGYNSSIFASHANNPVLRQISAEMHSRYLASDDFFRRPRPYADASGVQTNPGEGVVDMGSYIKRLFYLTGPDVLNDVLAIERPDYYRVFHMVEEGNHPMNTHKILDIDHQRDLVRLVDHYFPFANRALVNSGNEHSWLGT